MRRTASRAERGMVTAELACASLIVAVLVVVGLAVARVAVVQVQLYDAAAEVARQIAREDIEAADTVRKSLPNGVRVDVESSGPTTVVRTHAEVAIPLVGKKVPLDATVRVTNEPTI